MINLDVLYVTAELWICFSGSKYSTALILFSGNTKAILSYNSSSIQSILLFCCQLYTPFYPLSQFQFHMPYKILKNKSIHLPTVMSLLESCCNAVINHFLVMWLIFSRVNSLNFLEYGSIDEKKLFRKV
jgi:hypothetical protein